jgi:MFS family permease
MGAVSAVFTSGLLIGPMVSGWMLPLFGYWPTWSTAILVLIVDMIIRLLIIEAPKEPEDTTKIKTGVISTNGRDHDSSRDVEATGSETTSNSTDETTPLLQPPSQDQNQSEPASDTTDVESTQVERPPNFYRIVLAHPRALTAMVCHMASALVVTSLDTTLPIHVIRDFGWNTAKTSFMFFLVQIPQLILGSFTGWLKDVYGTKILTGVGYLLSGLLLWILGTPGKDGFDFIGSGHKGQVIYSSTLLALGFARSLTIGTGILEITSK